MVLVAVVLVPHILADEVKPEPPEPSCGEVCYDLFKPVCACPEGHPSESQPPCKQYSNMCEWENAEKCGTAPPSMLKYLCY